jgi:cytochrome c-type biogenesis protein CcmH/NrfG
MGVFFYGRRMYDRAIAEFRQVARLLPEFPGVHYNLGGALFGKGRFAAAEAEFRAAVDQDPDHLEARYFLGLTLRELGRPAEALQEMKAVLRAGPPDRLRREALEQIAILRDELAAAEAAGRGR